MLVGATVCDCAPVSLHDEKAYCIPVPPLWGEAVFMASEEPDTMIVSNGVVLVTPPTITVRPNGLVLKVIVTLVTIAAKVAA